MVRCRAQRAVRAASVERTDDGGDQCVGRARGREARWVAPRGSQHLARGGCAGARLGGRADDDLPSRGVGQGLAGTETPPVSASPAHRPPEEYPCGGARTPFPVSTDVGYRPPAGPPTGERGTVSPAAGQLAGGRARASRQASTSGAGDHVDSWWAGRPATEPGARRPPHEPGREAGSSELILVPAACEGRCTAQPAHLAQPRPSPFRFRSPSSTSQSLPAPRSSRSAA
jgi:hypothetical protein